MTILAPSDRRRQILEQEEQDPIYLIQIDFPPAVRLCTADVRQNLVIGGRSWNPPTRLAGVNIANRDDELGLRDMELVFSDESVTSSDSWRRRFANRVLTPIEVFLTFKDEESFTEPLFEFKGFLESVQNRRGANDAWLTVTTWKDKLSSRVGDQVYVATDENQKRRDSTDNSHAYVHSSFSLPWGR